VGAIGLSSLGYRSRENVALTDLCEAVATPKGGSMDNRILYPDEFRDMVESMQDATHKNMGTLTAHKGSHPQMGEIVIVSSREQGAALIHAVE
jgi:hypothetical protein